MEGILKLSFYLFTAASLSILASFICYAAYSIGRIRVRRAVLQTDTGLTVGTSTQAEWLPPSEGWGRFGTLLAWFSALFAGLAMVTRIIGIGHGPSNMYGFSLIFVFALTTLYVLFERVYKVKQLGAIVMLIAAGMAGYVWILPSYMRGDDTLVPALQNPTLLSVHVSCAIVAYATFAVSFAAAALYLVKERWQVAWLPSADLLDDLGFRAVTIGFPLLTLVLILGSIWAYQAWGTYWSWDPKETSALFTWLVYGVYLHTRTLRGFRGRRSAMILLFGFAAVMFTYYGNYFFGGLHSYSGFKKS